MIKPTKEDIGRAVVYRARPDSEPEQGTITAISEVFVFVRYNSGVNGIATLRRNLEWVSP